MRDFQSEIERTDDIHQLRAIIAELNEVINDLLAMSYEGDEAEERANSLELIRRYGEQKLERLLA
ncbi:MAG: hypothetical protein IT320_08955 [Anaerolineae bacterium]|nr:hypothetical protein [Anaerolineae bacterium]